MANWSVQGAKARFSELLETCLRDGPQIVTKRGKETAVLMATDQWRRLETAARSTLKQLLLAGEPRGLNVPKRGSARRRPPQLVV